MPRLVSHCGGRALRREALHASCKPTTAPCSLSRSSFLRIGELCANRRSPDLRSRQEGSTLDGFRIPLTINFPFPLTRTLLIASWTVSLLK
jgi:hypothetical protein